MPTVAAWLSNAEETRKTVARDFPELQGDELLTATIHKNVLIQVENARRLPSVAQRLKEGRVEVHGWVFVIEKGLVLAYDRSVSQFVPLDEADTSEDP
jgi:carbonic anhydrase